MVRTTVVVATCVPLVPVTTMFAWVGGCGVGPGLGCDVLPPPQELIPTTMSNASRAAAGLDFRPKPIRAIAKTPERAQGHPGRPCGCKLALALVLIVSTNGTSAVGLNVTDAGFTLQVTAGVDVEQVSAIDPLKVVGVVSEKTERLTVALWLG